jgi:multidrug transporter EmrE-like cation transporter
MASRSDIPRIVFYVLIIVLLETLAMSCFKKSMNDSRFFLAGILFYTCVGFMLCQTYHYTGLAMTNAIWSALSVMATTFVGVLMFKEMLHIHDYIAIALIGSGVLILKFTD